MKDSIGMALIILGYIMLALATISGIGYGLYNWGSVGLELGASAWMGFVLFMKMFGGGAIVLITGILLSGL